MSATTKQCREALHALVKEWFLSGSVPVEFSCPISQENILGYLTTPAETAVSPNFLIVHTINSTTRAFVVGGEEQPAKLGILLACRLDKAQATAEASRKTAEDWLDDAEEYLLRQLAASEGDDWHSLEASAPARDANRTMYGKFRTSNIVINVEKR